jgi:hypothetical protein
VLSPQLLVSGIFGLIWAALAVYLLVLHRGPEQLGNFHLRSMGVATALLAIYNGIRFVLEWRRLRRMKNVGADDA